MESTFDNPLAETSRSMVAVKNASIDRILFAAREHLGTEIAFVSRFLEGDMKELTHVSTDLELPMGAGYVDPREDSYCWHIAQGRLPELIQDPADYPFAQTLGITQLLPVGCHLNTPLRLSDGKIYGSFCCLSRAPDRSMTERDLGTLRAFAALAVEQIESTLEAGERHTALSRSINAVIEERAIAIAHQPIVALQNREPIGAEALARFTDAEKRGPDMWFNEAIEIGLADRLELLAVEKALATLPKLNASHYLSINASPEMVLSGLLEPLLETASKERIVIEVTEHQKVSDFKALKNSLDRISSHARIAIDDVGAGYAGMRHLVDLGPDLLKLDMSLTRNVHRDPARRALVGAMVSFAADIGSRLVAEGIENEAEAALMRDLGVDYGQGYLFGRPELTH